MRDTSGKEPTVKESGGYIRHWLQGEQPLERANCQVFGAADRILKAGRLAVESAMHLTNA